MRDVRSIKGEFARLDRRIAIVVTALVAAFVGPLVGHALGFSVFVGRALGIGAAMLLMYPVVVTQRTGRSLLAWIGASAATVACVFALSRLF